MNKSAIQKFAIQARKDLIAQVKQQAYNYGIDANGFGDENATTVNGVVLPNEKVEQRKELIRVIKDEGYEKVMDRVAYTWFNRFIALRYMEVNDYLPTHIRVFTNDKGEFKPAILKDALSLDLKGLDKDKVIELLNNPTGEEDLYRYLLLTQCNALNEELPEMFEKLGSYEEILLPLKILSDESVIAHLVNDIAEDDFKEAVEIIGWLFQEYIAEPKDKLINARKKYTDDDIPFVTQLFTSDWIVKYLVDNSLGKYWIERNEKSNLNEKLEYFIMPKDNELVYINDQINPEEITFFDPCMGSGHILVYAFEVLMNIYKEGGYSERDSAKLIVEKNLYGLDIDERAYQIAYFALMMKGRSYDRKFLTKNIKPNLYRPIHDEKLKTTGALIVVNELGNEPQETDEIRLDTLYYKDEQANWHFRKLLANQYTIICTNPPYMNSKYMPNDLKADVERDYNDYKTDLFSAFIVQTLKLTKNNGYVGMLTPYVWMFITSYEKLREFILSNSNISSLIQLEYNAFEGACVPVCCFVLKKTDKIEKGEYIKLSDFKGIEVQAPKTLEAIKNPECGYRFTTTQENFSKIPGSPIAYWSSNNMTRVFDNCDILETISNPKQGLITGAVDLFVRAWYECNWISVNLVSNKSEKKRKGKWFPYCNGGSYKKWYGNNVDLVNWENDGEEIKNFYNEQGKLRSRPQNQQFYFCEGGTWTAITSGEISVRYFSTGYLFSNAGMAIFTDFNKLIFLIAFLNGKLSKLYLSIFNEGLNYNQGDIAKLPIIFKNNLRIENITKENVDLSKIDWDAFETSWDFEKHPLINGTSIKTAFENWEDDCNNRFNQLKANEEELNRIFIDIYGLQDELTPEVEDKDVTVSKADLERDIKSFISYSVGCMFGRYSLDIDGLAYAGGDFDKSKYTTFIPYTDNIIPISDEDYFNDKDIVNRFIEFVKVVYGENTLEENLDFIAKALKRKGDSSIEIIRSYFLNDFYKDHLKRYQKRPIYWLFDSGKKNGFKALIYMHRYQKDLLAKVRTDYVHEQQERYSTQIDNIKQSLLTASASEKVKLTKIENKLKDQSLEIQQYEEKIKHLADKQIEIDLDDGVKNNYALFSDVLAKI